MKTWGEAVCVEGREGWWDSRRGEDTQGRGFINHNSPKQEFVWPDSPRLKGPPQARRMDPAPFYPKYWLRRHRKAVRRQVWAWHLQQAAGGSLLHMETSGASKKPQEASPKR